MKKKMLSVLVVCVAVPACGETVPLGGVAASASPITLGQPDSQPLSCPCSLELGQDRVYIAQHGVASNILGLPKDGRGASAVIAEFGGSSARAFALGPGEKTFYWGTTERSSDRDTIAMWSSPAGGGAPSRIGATIDGSWGTGLVFAGADGANLYAGTTDHLLNSDLFVVGATGPRRSLAKAFTFGSAIDEDFVYWVEAVGGDDITYSLSASPKAGGAARVLSTFEAGVVEGVVVDDMNVYIAGFDARKSPGRATISAVPKAGGPRVVLAESDLIPAALTTALGSVYWAECQRDDVDPEHAIAPCVDGVIRRVARTGGASARVVDTGSSAVVALRVDASGIYSLVSDRRGTDARSLHVVRPLP